MGTGIAAENGDMSVEVKKLSAQRYCVAYVDVMGQKANLEKLREAHSRYAFLDDQSYEENVGKIVSELDNTIVKVHQFHVSCNDAIQSMREVFKERKLCGLDDIKLIFISDSAVIYFPLGENLNENFTKMINVFFGLQILLFDCLSNQLPIRGGVEIGICTELPSPSMGVYGVALADSYLLESHSAEWPRIVIGKILSKYIAQESRKIGEAKFLQDNFIFDQEDAENYSYMISMQPQNNFQCKQLEKAISFAENQIKKFENDEKHGPRYKNLLNFLSRMNTPLRR